MNVKKIILHILIRIGILIFLTGSVFLLWYFTFDPHKFCDENGHKHVDGGFGMFFLILIVILIFYLGLVIEMFYLLEKKEGNLALTNLTFLIVSSCLALPYCIR